MKFIACYDDTELSKRVIKEAQKHARVWNADLDIVKAVHRKDPIDYEQLAAMEEQFHSEIKDLFKGVEVPYKVHLDVDDHEVGEIIIRIAERLKADMLFIGPKKRSRVGKLLFGSVAQYIVLHAECPVVTVSRGALYAD
ncbi:MAG: universal stress protein [Desulfobacteraceae bacterium]|nr:MAG: universal stress protein [Desulfobacteraceae bacterium]